MAILTLSPTRWKTRRHEGAMLLCYWAAWLPLIRKDGWRLLSDVGSVYVCTMLNGALMSKAAAGTREGASGLPPQLRTPALQMG